MFQDRGWSRLKIEDRIQHVFLLPRFTSSGLPSSSLLQNAPEPPAICPYHQSYIHAPHLWPLAAEVCQNWDKLYILMAAFSKSPAGTEHLSIRWPTCSLWAFSCIYCHFGAWCMSGHWPKSSPNPGVGQKCHPLLCHSLVSTRLMLDLKPT